MALYDKYKELIKINLQNEHNKYVFKFFLNKSSVRTFLTWLGRPFQNFGAKHSALNHWSMMRGFPFLQVEQYDPSSDTWTTTTSMIEHRSSVGVGVLDGLLYAVGGYNGQTTVNTVERYNPRTEEWTMISEMTTARSMLGVASLNGHLYAVGKYCAHHGKGPTHVPYASLVVQVWGVFLLCIFALICYALPLISNVFHCFENSPNTVAK